MTRDMLLNAASGLLWAGAVLIVGCSAGPEFPAARGAYPGPLPQPEWCGSVTGALKKAERELPGAYISLLGARASREDLLLEVAIVCPRALASEYRGAAEVSLWASEADTATAHPYVSVTRDDGSVVETLTHDRPWWGSPGGALVTPAPLPHCLIDVDDDTVLIVQLAPIRTAEPLTPGRYTIAFQETFRPAMEACLTDPVAVDTTALTTDVRIVGE